MRKMLILFALIGSFMLLQMVCVVAEDYLNFQEIVFDSDDAFLLEDYQDDDYNKAYKEINKRRFIGWKLTIVNKSEELEFISETKLKIYNNGFSTIKHDITLDSSVETKYQLSATGGIKVSGKGNVKKFKGSVDADIKASVSYAKTTTNKEKYEFEIVVDPLTYVRIVTRGRGTINNGVGKHYFFWVETKRGGWETFNQTTEYYEIIKERI